MTMEPHKSPPSKRRKLNAEQSENPIIPISGRPTSQLLSKPISPPLLQRKRPSTSETSNRRIRETGAQEKDQKETPVSPNHGPENRTGDGERKQYIPSPIQLTRIKDMSDYQNVDTLGLEDILGDPMIRECWNFNYLFDIGFVM